MAKKCMVARERKREKAAKSGAGARDKLKALIKDVSADFDTKLKAVLDLSRRKRDESECRQTRRCMCCGRPHAVYRKFRLCRMCLRQAVMKGWLPGVTKSSW